MLFKSHNDTYLEDYGLLRGNKVFLIESKKKVSFKPKNFSKVVRIKAVWMDKDIRISCDIADTEDKKKAGLQGYKKLDPNKGLYFPYDPYTSVKFHQGSVKFPLDIMFFKDENIIDIIENTKVGSKESWSCEDCTGVLEVSGGFIKDSGIKIGDRVLLCTVSERDLEEIKVENAL